MYMWCAERGSVADGCVECVVFQRVCWAFVLLALIHIVLDPWQALGTHLVAHQTLKALDKQPVQLSWCEHMLKTVAAVSALHNILRRCNVGPHQHRRVHVWAFPTCPDLPSGNWKEESSATARRVELVFSSGCVLQEDLQVQRCTCAAAFGPVGNECAPAPLPLILRSSDTGLLKLTPLIAIASCCSLSRCFPVHP